MSAGTTTGRTAPAFNSPRNKRAGSAAPWLTVRNLSTRTDGEVVEMVINGAIGYSWFDDSGTTSSEFRKQFDAIPKGKKVHVRINSEGGSVGDALEIYNLLQSRKEDCVCFNDGYALSSASIILLGGGRSVTPSASLTMIHEPWSYTEGDESDHIKAAEMLRKHGETIAGIYAKHTGKTVEEMRAAMKSETWLTGEEAIEFGLSDDDGDEDSTAIENRVSTLDLSKFQNVPKALFQRIQNSARNTSGNRNNNTAGAAGTQNKMDKLKILAALKDAGINLPDNSTDEAIFEAFAKLGRDNLAAATASASATTAVENMKKQLDAEKRVRVEAEISRRGENKIANNNRKWWVDLAMADEPGTLAQIDALPVARPGGDPIGVSASVGFESRLEEIKKVSNAAQRYSILKNEWNGIYADAVQRDNRQRLGVQNSNSYSSTLVTQFLLDGAVTKLQNMWTALRVFTRDYSTDRYKPRATGQLKYVTAGSTVQKNATSFESGNSTVDNVQIAVDQYTAAFQVTNDELNSGLRMENLIDVNVAQLADKVLSVAFAPLATGALTTNAAIVRAASAFAFSDMATAWGTLKKSPLKYAVLDGEYMARIINSPAFYQATGTEAGGQDGWKRFGWDGVYLNTNWTGTHAGAGDQNIRGLFCNPQIIGAIAGLPLTPPNIPGSVLQESTIQIPGVDVSVASHSWFSLQSRTMWMSYDIMFGTALLDESAGVLLTSA